MNKLSVIALCTFLTTSGAFAADENSATEVCMSNAPETAVQGQEYLTIANRLGGKTLKAADVNGIVQFRFSLPDAALAALYLTTQSGQNSVVGLAKRFVQQIQSTAYFAELSWQVTDPTYFNTYTMSACLPIDGSLISGSSSVMLVWPPDGSTTYVRSVVLQ